FPYVLPAAVVRMIWSCIDHAHLGFVFFFQAEDGIRDYKVTGVQTCALPISRHLEPVDVFEVPGSFEIPLHAQILAKTRRYTAIEIGRASCRERVQISGVAGSFQRRRSQSTGNVSYAPTSG